MPHPNTSPTVRLLIDLQPAKRELGGAPGASFIKEKLETILDFTGGGGEK